MAVSATLLNIFTVRWYSLKKEKKRKDPLIVAAEATGSWITHGTLLMHLYLMRKECFTTDYKLGKRYEDPYRSLIGKYLIKNF